jgi:lipoprotein-anchoring transpeptidase ErfK/SrfK
VLETLEGEGEPAKRWLDRRAVRIGARAAAAVALLGAAGLVALMFFNEDDDAGPRPSPPSAPEAVPHFLTAHVRRKTTLYEEPHGSPAIKIARRTEWGTPRVLGVVRRHGSWLAVQAPELKNGAVGWLPEDKARLDTVAYSLHVDRSRRRLEVRRDGRTIRRMTVAVGRPGNRTPTGRFSVTDKLKLTHTGSPYGCCVVALTGHQVHLPPGWPGGDRLAVHATADTWSVGRAVSSGCMRTTVRQARWLIKRIPLGAPIFIRR